MKEKLEIQKAKELLQKEWQERHDAAAKEYNDAVLAIQQKYGVSIGISTAQIFIKPN